jgi:hypothetical protein
MTRKANAKTEQIYVIQSNYGYGHGWEDTTASYLRWEALTDLRSYRRDQPEYPHRMIQRRVWKDTQEPYRGPHA